MQGRARCVSYGVTLCAGRCLLCLKEDVYSLEGWLWLEENKNEKFGGPFTGMKAQWAALMSFTLEPDESLDKMASL